MTAHEGPPANPNRTRDHLANERTFLAWVRTALGLIGLGFVLARMGLFLRQLARAGGLPGERGVPAGIEFLLVGLVFLVLGTGVSAWGGWHHRRTLRAIEAGRYEPASGSVLVLTAVVVAGGVLIAALLFARIAAIEGPALP
jgi:putative membrane protein